MNCPRKGWGLPSQEIQDWHVGCRAPCLWVPALVNLWGNILWYLLRGKVFACTPGPTFIIMCLVPFFVTSCSIVWKVTWPFDACSVSREPSWGMLEVSMLSVGWVQGPVQYCTGSTCRGWICCFFWVTCCNIWRKGCGRGIDFGIGGSACQVSGWICVCFQNSCIWTGACFISERSTCRQG